MVGLPGAALADWRIDHILALVSRGTTVPLEQESRRSYIVAMCSGTHHSDFVRLGLCKRRVAGFCMWARSSLRRNAVNQTHTCYSKPTEIDERQFGKLSRQKAGPGARTRAPPARRTPGASRPTGASRRPGSIMRITATTRTSTAAS